MQGSNEDCLPMRGHTRGGDALGWHQKNKIVEIYLFSPLKSPHFASREPKKYFRLLAYFLQPELGLAFLVERAVTLL